MIEQQDLIDRAAYARLRDQTAGGVSPGDRFGALTAVSAERRKAGSHYRWFWLCRCDCGVEKLFPVGNLQNLNSKSCGCMRAPRVAWARTKHGEGRRSHSSREYQTWSRMIGRCYNPANPKFKDYGGRGITVCDRWRHDFPAFLADMGRRPDGMSIDRIDVDGNYEPTNCRWATPLQQANNQRRHKRERL